MVYASGGYQLVGAMRHHSTMARTTISLLSSFIYYMATRVASVEGVACAAFLVSLEKPIISAFVLLVYHMLLFLSPWKQAQMLMNHLPISIDLL
jgi:hypothetical protein